MDTSSNWMTRGRIWEEFDVGRLNRSERLRNTSALEACKSEWLLTTKLKKLSFDYDIIEPAWRISSPSSWWYYVDGDALKGLFVIGAPKHF